MLVRAAKDGLVMVKLGLIVAATCTLHSAAGADISNFPDGCYMATFDALYPDYRSNNTPQFNEVYMLFSRFDQLRMDRTGGEAVVTLGDIKIVMSQNGRFIEQIDTTCLFQGDWEYFECLPRDGSRLMFDRDFSFLDFDIREGHHRLLIGSYDLSDGGPTPLHHGGESLDFVFPVNRSSESDCKSAFAD